MFYCSYHKTRTLLTGQAYDIGAIDAQSDDANWSSSRTPSLACNKSCCNAVWRRCCCCGPRAVLCVVPLAALVPAVAPTLLRSLGRPGGGGGGGDLSTAWRASPA